MTTIIDRLPVIGYYGLNKDGYEVLDLKENKVLRMFDAGEVTAQPVCLVSDARAAIAAASAVPQEPYITELIDRLRDKTDIVPDMTVKQANAHLICLCNEAADALASAPPSGTADRNFCGRCGKRMGNIDSIHTCTPPEDRFCDKYCSWTDHHPACKYSTHGSTKD